MGISAMRFRALPADEKHLWRSHYDEMKFAALVPPDIPELAGRAYFDDLVTTYGKTSTPANTTATTSPTASRSS